MCGISGIVGPLASQQKLEQLLLPILHRGEKSHQCEMNVNQHFYALGMHRLAIVDDMNDSNC